VTPISSDSYTTLLDATDVIAKDLDPLTTAITDLLDIAEAE
jgi:hypothetical protein